MGNNQTPLKLVFIAARFHPFKGGAEQNAYQLATRAAAAGHQVTVLTTNASPNKERLPSTEKHKGVTIVRCFRWNSQLNLGFYPSMLPKLLKLEADVVHNTNGPGFIWQELCILLKKLTSKKTKFICTPHGPFLATLNTATSLKRIVGKTGKLVMSPYFRLIWGNIWDAVIQVNPEQHRWLTQDFGVKRLKIRLVTNGINADMIIKSKPHTPNPVTITYVGRISWYKGLHKVIYALRELKDENIAARFIMMGKMFDPGILDLVEELELEDEIQFVDRPSDTERDRILEQESEVHILPSEWEATGVGLLEGMAKGNAIVTTTGNEAHQMLITEGENGFVYNFDDTMDLVKILSNLVTDSDLRENMIKTNLSKVHQFTWEVIYPEYEKLVLELTSNKKNG